MKNALFRFIGLLVTVSCIFAEEKSDLIKNLPGLSQHVWCTIY